GQHARARSRQTRARTLRRASRSACSGARRAGRLRRGGAGRRHSRRRLRRASRRTVRGAARDRSREAAGRKSTLRAPDGNRKKGGAVTEQLAADVDAVPGEIAEVIEEVDAFIEAEIRPLEREGDNARFFDHRREHARADFDAGGIPSAEWEALLEEMVSRADRVGLWRYGLPEELGGRGASNLALAVVREHLNRLGIGLHNDPQSEISMIGNFPTVILAHEFGTPAQREVFVQGGLRREVGLAFGLTEPGHGSDATRLETTARRDGDEWVINGVKRFNSGMHRASHDLVFARTSGSPG